MQGAVSSRDLWPQSWLFSSVFRGSRSSLVHSEQKGTPLGVYQLIFHQATHLATPFSLSFDTEKEEILVLLDRDSTSVGTHTP